MCRAAPASWKSDGRTRAATEAVRAGGSGKFLQVDGPAISVPHRRGRGTRIRLENITGIRDGLRRIAVGLCFECYRMAAQDSGAGNRLSPGRIDKRIGRRPVRRRAKQQQEQQMIHRPNRTGPPAANKANGRLTAGFHAVLRNARSIMAAAVRIRDNSTARVNREAAWQRISVAAMNPLC